MHLPIIIKVIVTEAECENSSVFIFQASEINSQEEQKFIWSDLGCRRWWLPLTSVWLFASLGRDTFSFINKELGSSCCVKKKKKKKSSSQVRREQTRKEERSLRKAAESTEKVAEASESEEFADFQCSQCESGFKTEEDLNAHISDLHTTLPTPERSVLQIADPLLTLIRGDRKDGGTMP